MTNDAPAQASVEARPFDPTILLAMAQNYAGGHCWDHLDGQVCLEAHALIERLRRITDERHATIRELITERNDALERAVKAEAALSPPPTVGAEDEAVAFTSSAQLREMGRSAGMVAGMWLERIRPEDVALYTRPSPSASKTGNGPLSEESQAISETTVQRQPAEGDGRARAQDTVSSAMEVKGLEWVDLSDASIAHTPFGIYKVARAGETVNMFIARSDLPKSFHATEDEAKAAAQADYEQRIRSCIASEKTEGGL